MQDYRYCTIKDNHSFYDIKNNPICIKWKGKSKIKEDLFDLSEAYFECACDIFEEILENVKQRDYIDQNREVSPLRKADDALLLDNTDMTIPQQKEWLQEQFNKIVKR